MLILKRCERILKKLCLSPDASVVLFIMIIFSHVKTSKYLYYMFSFSHMLNQHITYTNRFFPSAKGKILRLELYIAVLCAATRTRSFNPLLVCLFCLITSFNTWRNYLWQNSRTNMRKLEQILLGANGLIHKKLDWLTIDYSKKLITYLCI